MKKKISKIVAVFLAAIMIIAGINIYNNRFLFLFCFIFHTPFYPSVSFRPLLVRCLKQIKS